jgi:hypothetical protein
VRRALGAVLGGLVLLSLGAPHPVQAQGVITVSHVVPGDIPGGAQSATLEDAAVFAWQEFIALNWPAVAQTGVSGDRETPDTTKTFGEVDPTFSTPLVWETFRHKLEVFPGTGTPHGGANYDALPQYIYNPPTWARVTVKCNLVMSPLRMRPGTTSTSKARLA